MSVPVVIVGGGLAGLVAAHLLAKAGLAFQLIEARDRLGGRILSAGANGQADEDGFDLGASWFWPAVQPGLAALVDELKLATFAQCSDGDVLFERMSREPVHRYKAVALEQGSFRFVGGTAALVDALRQHLPSQSIRLGTAVKRLERINDGVSIAVARPDGSEERVLAAQVILAMPPRLILKFIAFAPQAEWSDMHRWEETPTWMAPAAKFVALYERPFWRDLGLCGTAQSVVGPMMEMHDATTASGKAALLGFLGMGVAQREAMPEARIREACISQLARLYGPEANRPVATIMKDWAFDRWTATALDRGGSGHPALTAHPWVTGLWSQVLFLAGSETAAREPGYLAGAVDAAHRAVRDVLQRRAAAQFQPNLDGGFGLF